MFATSEDEWEFTMVPRLFAAGADLTRIGRVQVEYDGMVTGLTTPVDVPALGVYIASHDVAPLVLDPLTSVMDGRIDAHRTARYAPRWNRSAAWPKRPAPRCSASSTSVRAWAAIP